MRDTVIFSAYTALEKDHMVARTLRRITLSKKAKTLVLFALIFGLYFSSVPKYLTSKLHSANLTAVSVTMSTSKLSFKGLVAAGNTAGSSVVTLQSSGAPSVSTANLFVGDSVRIGDTITAGLYTVTGINSSTQFELASGLSATDFQTGDMIVSTRAAALTVRFTTASAIANGAFRILVPASAANNNDGLPDHLGFDFGGSFVTPTVTCPADVANFDFVGGTASPDAVTLNSIHYHAYTCRYSGTGTVGQVFNGGLNFATISAVINPAATTGHAVGTADQYKVIVQNLNGSAAGDTALDSTSVTLAPIEGVRVTATVDPTLQFSIAGVATGDTNCLPGPGTTVDTTATGGNIIPNVPLGTVAIGTFTNAAQLLTVSTNAANGYAVTTQENDQLKTTTAACVDAGTDLYGAGNGCIPDVGSGSETGVGINWSTPGNVATKGFGYTMAAGTAQLGNMTNYYNSGGSSCGGTNFCARKFPDNQNGEVPQRIFFSTTVRDTDTAYVCYRAVVGVTQEAGDYTNNITYTATGLF